MNRFTGSMAGIVLAGSMLLGCATSSEEQHAAIAHQEKADNAARRGAYSVAADEQKRAEDSHHEAVKKAMKEGSPIPPQPQVGDRPAQQP